MLPVTAASVREGLLLAGLAGGRCDGTLLGHELVVVDLAVLLAELQELEFRQHAVLTVDELVVHAGEDVAVGAEEGELPPTGVSEADLPGGGVALAVLHQAKGEGHQEDDGPDGQEQEAEYAGYQRVEGDQHQNGEADESEETDRGEHVSGSSRVVERGWVTARGWS